MIEISGLQKSFGAKKVLDGIDLTVPDGSIFGLVGINGAGKSTLLRLLSGVLRADGGSVRIGGQEVYDCPAAKKELFFLPDDPYYAADTTAQKLIELYSAFYPFHTDVYEQYEQRFRLARKAPLRTFSKGMKRQLFIALALACRPRYLFLDEAFDGLDPLARLECKRGLIELQEERESTVIISSHSLRELEDICSGFALLDGGQIADSGDLQGALEQVTKFQVALSHEARREDFPFACVSFEASGRVAKLIVRGDKEAYLAELDKLFPSLISKDSKLSDNWVYADNFGEKLDARVAETIEEALEGDCGDFILVGHKATVKAALKYLCKKANCQVDTEIWNCELAYFIALPDGSIKFVSSGVDFIPPGKVTNNFKRNMLGKKPPNIDVKNRKL